MLLMENIKATLLDVFVKEIHISSKFPFWPILSQNIKYSFQKIIHFNKSNCFNKFENQNVSASKEWILFLLIIGHSVI